MHNTIMAKTPIYAIEDINGITIPITNIAGLFVRESECADEVLFYAAVLDDDDTAYKRFNPDRLNEPPECVNFNNNYHYYLIKVKTYNWENEPSLAEYLNPEKFEKYSDPVFEWTLNKGKNDMRRFADKVYKMMPKDNLTIIKFE